MSQPWTPEITPDLPAITASGWARIIMRGLVLIVFIVLGVIATIALRLIEWPLYGARRPWTQYVTQWVCRAWFVGLGMRHTTQGTRMAHPGAVVANHASWLDIFSLNARKRIYFVSKAEVAGWPGIGFLARLVGTVFIARDPKQAKSQTDLFQKRLLLGHKLLFFPEGTSTDGLRVLSFKSTLFQSFFTPELKDRMYIQPVTVVYTAPAGQEDRFYGWWGDMEFGPHLLHVLAAPRQGEVHVVYHDPVKVAEFDNRKALAAHVETVVRSGMPADRQIR